MNKYIKLLEDFNPEEDLEPIMPKKHEEEEEEHNPDDLEVMCIPSAHGREQWYVVNVDKREGVAGPFVEKGDAAREMEIMQGKHKKHEEDEEKHKGHKHHEEEDLEESNDRKEVKIDAAELAFMAAQYTDEDLEPIASEMWTDVDDLVSHILDSIKDHQDKVDFLTAAKKTYPEIKINA